MSRHTEKQFTNDATTPMIVSVAACIDDNGIVRDMHAAGGIVGQNDIQRAEAQRMHRWIRNTFVGQNEFFFNAHNGKVPAPSFADSPSAPEIKIINTIDFSPEAIADAMKGTPGLIERIMRRDFSKGSTQTTTGAASDRKEARAVTVGHPNYEFAPKVGTYWQDRSRTVRFFVVVSTHECDGHSHVRMLRVDNQRGGEYEWAFTTPSAWNEMFAPTTADKVPGLTPYAQMAAELYDVSFKPARERRVAMPPELGMGYGLIESLFRDFIENVPFDGSEQPPAAGERYFSVISGSTYTVVDVRRKLYSEDYYVTMERDGDKHRAKFTYRDHATWLTVWRPVDDEGNPRKVVEVELKLDTRDASEALRKVGETAHEAASAMFEFHATDAIARIVRELNKRLPGWVEQPPGPVVYDTADLIIRAIRSLSRHMRNYEELAVASAKELRKMVDLETENAALKKARTAPAIGSVWRTNSTGTYATVMHFYPQSGVVKMRSAKGGEYDCPVERLFEYSTLVRGPATLLDAIGSIETNAPGLARDRAALNELIEGQVLHVYRVDRDMHGDVTIHGRLSDKPRRG